VERKVEWEWMAEEEEEEREEYAEGRVFVPLASAGPNSSSRSNCFTMALQAEQPVMVEGGGGGENEQRSNNSSMIERKGRMQEESEACVFYRKTSPWGK
jgi:hypothetical protein